MVGQIRELRRARGRTSSPEIQGDELLIRVFGNIEKSYRGRNANPENDIVASEAFFVREVVPRWPTPK